MRSLREGAALAVLCALHAWHVLLRAVRDPPPAPRGGREEAQAADGPAVAEYERGWYDYVRGFDVHHGPVDAPDDSPEHGSFRRGLRRWAASNYLRGYTLGDEVYVCPDCPRVVRVHQAGHAPSFGRAFETLADERRPDGGLPDEPLATLDVMLPGRFPHTLLRLRDSRGLTRTYDRWVATGRIVRYGD